MFYQVGRDIKLRVSIILYGISENASGLQHQISP